MRLQKNALLTAAIGATCLLIIAGCQTQNEDTAGTLPLESDIACEEANQGTASDIQNLVGGTVSSTAIDGFLASRMEALNIPGASVAIINDKQVAYHRALGLANATTIEPVTGCSIFQGASITKPLFGFFVMTFVEEGMLDLDRPLFEYLPYPDIAHDERYKLITARMVLAHQTGLPNWRTDFDDQQLFIEFDPGTGFSYSGEAFQYLSLVLQKIAGVDHAGLEALFQDRVATPLGMTQTQIIPSPALLARRVDPHLDGKPAIVRETNSYQDFGAAYGVHSEAADFSKWLIGLMNRKGLSQISYEAYFAPQNTPVPKDENPLILSQDYGLGFVILETPLGQLYVHDGNNPGFSSSIVLAKDQGWGVVVFSNANQTSTLGLELMLMLNNPS